MCHCPQIKDDKNSAAGHKFLQASFCRLKTGLPLQKSLRLTDAPPIWMPEIFKYKAESILVGGKRQLFTTPSRLIRLSGSRKCMDG